MRFLLNKFAELFAGEMILSLTAAMIIQSIEIFSEKLWGFAAALIFTVLICIFYFLHCRKTLFEEFIRSGELSAKKYFMHAGFPLAFMTITAFILAFFKTEPVYTYMFLPFKLFAICGVYKPLAALLSGVLLSFPMLAVYLLRPKTEELEDE